MRSALAVLVLAAMLRSQLAARLRLALWVVLCRYPLAAVMLVALCVWGPGPARHRLVVLLRSAVAPARWIAAAR